MSNDSNLKTLLFGKTGNRNKRGRPHREWTDDVVEWCGVTLQELSHSARDWNNWQKMVKQASDVNGHWAQDLWWWWHNLLVTVSTYEYKRRKVLPEP